MSGVYEDSERTRDGTPSPASTVPSSSPVTDRRAEDAERLLDESRRLSAALTDVAVVINATLDFDDILRRVVTAARTALGCDSCVVDMLEDGILVGRYAHGFPAKIIGERFPLAEVPFAAEALQSGQVVAIDDAPSDPRAESEVERRYAVRSVMAVPLLVRDAALGVCFLNFHESQHPFSPAEIDFGQKLSESLSLALDNARLYAAEREARAEATSELAVREELLDVAAVLAGSRDLETVLATVVDAVTRLTGRPRVIINAVDEERRELTMLAGRGHPLPPLNEPVSFDALSEMVRCAISGHRPLVLDHTHLEDRDSLDARLLLFVPLMVRGSLVGNLAVDTPGEYVPFSDRDRAVVEGVAVQAAVAIDNARLHAAERDAARRARRELEATNALLDAGETLASTMEVAEVLQRVSDVVAAVTGIPRVTMAAADQDGTLILSAAHGSVGDLLGARFEATAEAVAALQQGESMVVDIDDPLVTPAWRQAMRAYGVVSVLAVPIAHGTRLLGVFGADHPGERYEFTKRERRLAQGIAAQAATALENARLFEDERSNARLNRALNRINQTLLSTLRREEVMHRIVTEARRAAGADGSTIAQLEGDHWVVTQAYGVTPDPTGVRLPRTEPLALEHTRRSKSPQFFEDLMNDSRADHEVAKWIGRGAIIQLPLSVQGDVSTVVTFTWDAPRRFSERERTFMERLCTTLSLAFENLRLYEGERRVAETLQAALLMMPPSIPGMAFSHIYHSATESARVGGDFYDLFELEDGLVAVTIGDISGKGIDAAVLTSLVKNTVRAQAFEHGKTPAQVVRLTNTVLFKETRPEMFATLFFGVLDRRDGRLVYCNAGHTAAACCRGPSVTRMPPNSPIIGAFSDTPFTNTETRLREDDLLFLYTDGLTEARRGATLYGEERLFALLSRLGGLAPRVVVRRAVEEATRFAGGKLSDDLAVLALQLDELPDDIPTQQTLPLE
jgi:GAF domain-containing protein